MGLLRCLIVFLPAATHGSRAGILRINAERFRRLNDSIYFGFFAPYLLRLRLRPSTPRVSRAPRTMWYRTPGKSRTRPPRTRTIECSCRLCSSPGMYAVISLPLESRTRATLRSAEFGFLGVIVLTWRQTPRLNAQPSSTGDLVL